MMDRTMNTCIELLTKQKALIEARIRDSKLCQVMAISEDLRMIEENYQYELGRMLENTKAAIDDLLDDQEKEEQRESPC